MLGYLLFVDHNLHRKLNARKKSPKPPLMLRGRNLQVIPTDLPVNGGVDFLNPLFVESGTLTSYETPFYSIYCDQAMTNL